MPKNKLNSKSTKSRSLFSRILKYFLICFGSIALLIIAFAVWIYFSLISGPDSMEISEFHPFKSSKARTEYLAFEDKMAEKWPVISEGKIIETSYGKTFMRISGPIDGPTLVLLPAGGANSLIWHANIKALSSVYRTYALDNIYDYGNPQLAIDRLNKVAPGIKTELISGTGHDLLFTHTDEINKMMLEFLK